MGRRRRNQDTIQVADGNQSVESQESQLQVTPAQTESVNKTETKSMTIPMEEIPYDDRPIPEAYFPPEDDEPAQEFMPEPNIQQTPSYSYKTVSKKELDALKFEVKTVEPVQAETKTDVKETPVETKNIDFSALQFDVKPIEKSVVDSAKTADVNNPVATQKAEIPNIKIDVDKLISKPEASNTTNDSLYVAYRQFGTDSLAAQNDSLANDSLAKDSVAFIPVEKPAPKREIIKIDGKELPETINNAWWFTPALFVLFVAYIIVIRDRKKAIFSELQSFINPNTDGSIFGIQWLQNSKYKFLLSALGVVTSALYLFLANSMSIASIWIFFVAVIIFVVGKNMMLSLLEYIYFQGADVTSMSEAFMVLVRVTGLMLIPSVLGLSFAPENYRTFFIYFGAFVVGLAIIAFNFKLIVNFLRGITSIFYMILYLCTLEVIPVAIFFVLGLLPRV